MSSDKKAFDETVQPYQEALTKSGYKVKLNFKPPEERKKRTRNRIVVWFNPPYSCNVATNIGRKFLKIVDESFSPTHVLRKIFNKNTVKLSYSCMPNMHNIISAHNLTNTFSTAFRSQPTPEIRNVTVAKKKSAH